MAMTISRESVLKVLDTLLWPIITLLVALILREPLSGIIYRLGAADSSSLLAAIFSWPVIVGVGLLLMRKALSDFLTGVGQRATKFSAFQIEVELSQAELRAWSLPSLDDIKQPEALAWTSDSSSTLFEQIKNSTPSDYAIIDIGSGNEWLTSRLYIFSLMLSRMRGLKALVVLKSTNHETRRFLGLLSPSQVRWTLANRYPCLERAYVESYLDILPPLAVGAQSKVSKTGGLEPWEAKELVRKFIDKLQFKGNAQPQPSSCWTLLRENLWERADWLDEASLQTLFGTDLQESWITDDPDVAPSERAKMVLRRSGIYVAALGSMGRFSGLLDRSALLERAAKELVHQQSG